MGRSRRAWVILSAGLLLSAGPLTGQEPAPAPPALPVDPVLAPPPGRAGSVALAAVPPSPGATRLSLAEAVRTAMERNFGLLQAADSVTSSRHRYSASLAQFYPKLTPRYQRSADDSVLSLEAQQRVPWTGGSVRASAAFASTPEADNPINRSSNLSLILSQPLLRGFGPNASLYELRNSRRDREARERDLELTRQRLAVDVARAFYGVLEQRTLLAVARQSLERTRNLQRASEARLEVGLVSKLDVFRAQLQASQAQEAMLRAETGLEESLERFRLLLGLPPTDPVEPEAAELPDDLTAEERPDLPVLVEQARSLRLDLHEARDVVEDAQRGASLARQNLLPQLDLNLGFTQQGLGPSFSSAWSAADRQLNLTFSASYPVERSADLVGKALAEIALVSQRRSLQQRELEIETQVRSAVRELDQIRKSVELQKQAVDVAQQQLRLATLRYQRGLAPNFDVVDAESSLVQARSALVSLLARYQIARIELLRVTGQLDVEREFQP